MLLREKINRMNWIIEENTEESIINLLSKELNVDFVKLNLAQIEELGDLVGFPTKEYEMCSPEGETCWVEEKVIDQYSK